MNMARTVLIFDFDKTIIDCDSDNWVIDAFGASDRFEQLLLTTPWNSTMDMMMEELHRRGISSEQIADRLRQAPLDPHTISAIRKAYALGCELRIVSDANLFYIKTILEHHGLSTYFSEITTNPGFVDEEGRVRISPYHDFHTSSHGCSDCPPNMCKSVIVKRIQAEVGMEIKHIIYLGDGKGDYCPALQLTERDIVMPRKDYPIWDLICKNTMLVKARVYEWSTWEEQEHVLLELVFHLLFIEVSTAARSGFEVSDQDKSSCSPNPIKKTCA